MTVETMQKKRQFVKIRQKVEAFVENPIFQNVIILAIILNAIQLGLDTFPFFAAFRKTSCTLDIFFICVFCVELGLKMFAYRFRFFKDPWNIFDFIIITASVIPYFCPYGNTVFSVFRLLRAFRILRTSRLFSALPGVRVIINAMFRALPNISALAFMLLILYYIFAVLVTQMGFCSNIFAAVGVLFELMTMEGWQQTIEQFKDPMAPWFFIPFMLIASYIFLNLVVGIIIDSMQACAESAHDEKKDGEQKENDPELAKISEQLKQIQKQLDALAAGEKDTDRKK